MVRLTFVGQGVVQPLITRAARQFNTDFNILQADIETVNEKAMGFLMVEIMGEPEAIEQSLQFLRGSPDVRNSSTVQVEVIGYVS